MTAGLLAAIVAGTAVATLTGHDVAAESAADGSTEEITLVQASWEVDAIIDRISAQREAEREARRTALAKAEALEVTAQKHAEKLERAEAEAEAEARAEAEAAAEAEAQAEAEAKAPEWISPSNAAITSYYGQRWGRLHAGLDFANSTGDPIWAIGDGTVTYAGWMDGYGNMVVIDHGGGVETAYAHATEVVVGVGQEVAQGDTVSLTGSTGNSTGPHLHFEVRVDGSQVDPLPWLEERGVTF